MSRQNLIRMANRIGDFFEAMPDRDRALEDIVDHIRKFWEPRMRHDMLDHLDREGGGGLSDIVLTALTRHRATLMENSSPGA
ncbi:formate dehydrogenase [Pseudomonas moorei]|nr:formate dehydrogenase [Pseudomonas moorei]